MHSIRELADVSSIYDAIQLYIVIPNSFLTWSVYDLSELEKLNCKNCKSNANKHKHVNK